MNNNFAGTVNLLRLYLRRDCFLLPLWTFLPVILSLFVAATFTAMASQGMQSVLAEFDKDLLISALLGPVMSFDLPGAIVWRGTSQIALTLGIGSLLTVIRHTRTDEETGRSELIRANIVGPYASLTAALILAGAGNLAAGLLIALTMIALGGPAVGSFLFGSTMCVVGCFFAGIGALVVQLRESSGTARGIGFTVLGLGMALAILNNFGGGHTLLSWLAPMAWQRITQPFAGNHYWPLLYCAAFTAVPIIAAYILSAKRDLGAGILPVHSGRPEASPFLSGPIAFAWRLQKKGFIGWLTGTVLYIAVFAAISPGLAKRGGMSDWLSNLGGTSWSDEVGLGYIFIGISFYLISLFIAVYAMTAFWRLEKEEKEGRLEMLVDKPISRIRLMISHLLIVSLCSAALLLIMGFVGGLVYGIVSGDLSNEFRHVFAMSVSKIPSVWILLGAAAILYGSWPKITAMGWVIWISFAMLELAWETQLIDWSIMRISPFSYAHYTINISELSLLPLFWLLCIAAVLAGIGLLGFKNRDILTKA